MALALLPEPVIEDTYDELLNALSSTMKETLENLLQYFQEQWFVKVPPVQWCVHGLTMRTNNNCEGIHYTLRLAWFYLGVFQAFHSRFNRRVQIHHPNIWSFIKFLQGEESRFHHLSLQFNAGLGARTKQAKTISIQRRIDNLDKRYYGGSITVMEYLDGLSFSVAKRRKWSPYSLHSSLLSSARLSPRYDLIHRCHSLLNKECSLNWSFRHFSPSTFFLSTLLYSTFFRSTFLLSTFSTFLPFDVFPFDILPFDVSTAHPLVNVQRVRLTTRQSEVEPHLKVHLWQGVINKCVRLDRVVIQLVDDGDFTRIAHDIEQELCRSRLEMIFRIKSV